MSWWAWIASTIWSPIFWTGLKRGHRVLEDHRDPVAADRLQLLVGGGDELLALVAHRPADPRILPPGEADGRHRGHRLAGAGLADDAEDLSGLEREGDAVDGVHRPLVGGEVDLQVVDLEQGAGHGLSAQPDPRVEHGVDDVDDGAEHDDEEGAEHGDHQDGRDVELLDGVRAYWPTPWRLKTVSVRIAPPPITAAKSRPKSETTGMSELRST